jgi:hypothetical protein
MARYDKYDPISGGNRAALNAAWLDADLGQVIGVSLNASGKLVKGTAAQSGFAGVVCLTSSRAANDVVDVMQAGEIVECAGLAAGTKYYVTAAGALTATATGNYYVGFTVEADRLVVRCDLAAAEA